MKMSDSPSIELTNIKRYKPYIAGGWNKGLQTAFIKGTRTKVFVKYLSNDPDLIIDEIKNSIIMSNIKVGPRFYGLYRGVRTIGLVSAFLEGPTYKALGTQLHHNKINKKDLCTYVNRRHKRSLQKIITKMNLFNSFQTVEMDLIFSSSGRVSLIDFGSYTISKNLDVQPTYAPNYHFDKIFDLFGHCNW